MMLQVFLDCLYRSARDCTDSPAMTSGWYQTVTLTTRCLADLCHLTTDTYKQEPSLQVIFAKTFALVALLSSKSAQTRGCHHRYFDKFEASVLFEPRALSGLSQDVANLLRSCALRYRTPTEVNLEQQKDTPRDIASAIRDVELLKLARQISSQNQDPSDWQNPRPAKRRRLDDCDKLAAGPNRPLVTYTPQGLARAFGAQDDASTLNAWAADARELFEDLNLQNQVHALEYFAAMPCYARHGAKSAGCYREADVRHLRCRCESFDDDNNAKTKCLDEEISKRLALILSSILDSSLLQASKQLQVLALISAQSLFSHTSDLELLSLSTSPCGQWCLQRLHSSSREVRIAAVRMLPLFLTIRPDSDGSVIKRNRVIVLDFVLQATDTSDTRACETLISALGQIACTCGDEELHLVLLRLVNMLAHQNSLICALASTELKNLAGILSTSAEELFKPFSQTITVAVLKDYPGKPQKIQQLCDILNTTTDDFLLKTQADAIPQLVQWKRRDVLERIASISGRGQTMWSLCTQSRNLAATLALLVKQQPQHAELAIQEAFSQLNRHFDSDDLQSLLKAEPILVACNLLKVAGDVGDPERVQVRVQLPSGKLADKYRPSKG